MSIPFVPLTTTLLSCCLWTGAPPAERPLGPGDPLPRFVAHGGELTLEPGSAGQPLIIGNQGFDLAWGDLRITGDRLTLDRRNRDLRASGHVVVRRGDEVLRGETLHIDGAAGLLEIETASAESPPFFFSGNQIRRSPTSIVTRDGTLGLQPNGKGELTFRAREIRVESAGRLILEDSRLVLFGKPILRLRHVSIPVDLEPDASGAGARSTPSPVTFRVSRISGVAVGVGTNVTPVRDYVGHISAEISSRQGVQYSATIGHLLIGPRPQDQPRRILGTPGGLATSGEPVASTPLRQLLTARPVAPPRDPVLDFTDILPTRDPFSRPTNSAARSVFIDATLSGNREFGGSRFGPLTISRLPEIALTGSFPLSPPVNANDNATARRALHIPRFYLQGDAGLARFREKRLNGPRRYVSEQRGSAALAIGVSPLLIGQRLLTAGEVSLRTSRYSNDTTYRFTETTVSTAYIFAERTMLGGAYIQRTIGGSTPFFFDQIDTQNEGQVRGQIALGHGRYTLATIGRFDTRQGRLFDLEFGFAIRGTVLEPHFYYRKLNGAFGFNIALPGLTTP